MNTLIVVASRHGSTAAIAETLAQELRTIGQTVDVAAATDAPPVSGYQAVVIGSGVYFGSWLSQARRFVERNQAQLAEVPVWMFSSGPIAPSEPRPKDDPACLAKLMQQTGARGHRTFAGALRRADLGTAERFVIWNVNRLTPGGVPDGDFRDWESVRAWAHEIAASLAEEAAVPA